MPGLNAVCLKLKTEAECVISPTQGYRTHALFLNLIKQSSSKIAESLHKSTPLKPFTISSLQGQFRRQGKTLIISPSNDYFIRITFLDDDIFSHFMDGVLKSARQQLHLAEAHFTIDRVLLNQTESPLCNHQSFDDLLNSAVSKETINIHFLSPTVFRSAGKRNVIFPEPTLVFSSYLNKWQQFSTVKLPATSLQLDKILVARYKLATHILDFDSYREIGFEGTVTYELPAGISPEIAKTLNILADFAFYCGTGAKTTMGMGADEKDKMSDTISVKKMAFIITVGTTEEPLINSMHENTRNQFDTEVFIVYGRSIENQEAIPFKITTQLHSIAQSKGLKTHIYEIDNPENIDVCTSAFEKVFNDVSSINPTEVLVDVTGGTKPMVGALSHIALMSTPCVLSFTYTGGIRDKNGRVKSETMKPQIAQKTTFSLYRKRIIDAMGRFDYDQAMAYCSILPDSRLRTFIYKSIKGLWLWDNFRYIESIEEIKGLGETQLLCEDEQFSFIALIIQRLREHSKNFRYALESVIELANKEIKTTKAQNKGPDLLYLIADMLENTQRRIKESRFTDAVLRCYRCIECSIQLSLISNKVNPWKPEPTIPATIKETFFNIYQKPLPDKLSLYIGLDLLGVVTSAFSEADKTTLRSISDKRNYSYLEHGYNTVSKTDAMECYTQTVLLCAVILSHGGFTRESLDKYRDYIKHTV